MSRFRYTREQKHEYKQVMNLLNVPAENGQTYLAMLQEKAQTVATQEEPANDIIRRALFYIMHSETHYDVDYADLIKEPPAQVFGRINEKLDEIAQAQQRFAQPGSGGRTL